MKSYHTLAAAGLLMSLTGYAHAEDSQSEPAQADNPQQQSVSEADLKAQRTNKFTPIVLPFYDPSIEAGVSAVPLFSFYPDENDLVSDASTIAVPLIYTTNGSYITLLSGDIILKEDSYRFTFETGFKHTNLTLGGIENSQEAITFDGDAYVKVFDDFYLGLGAVYKTVKNTADNQAEQSQLEEMGYDSEYNSDLGYRLSFIWDTREQYYYPHDGFRWNFAYEDHPDWLGNDEERTYSSLFSDYRYFHSVNDNSNHIIATKFTARYLLDAENAPSSAFSTYGRQGREIQRGYKLGDYVAANMANLEVEYRHKFSGSSSDFVNRSAMVLIGGIGKSFGQQLDGGKEKFSDADWLGTVGIGYRYTVLPYERLNIKMDLVHNTDGDTIVYFGFGETI